MFLISSKAEVEALYTLTLAPFLSKHLAVARPIPCAAPVIRATLFSSMMTRSVHWATGLLDSYYPPIVDLLCGKGSIGKKSVLVRYSYSKAATLLYRHICTRL